MANPKARAPSQFCESFRRRQCMGCTGLHLPYGEQLGLKADYVRACFERLAPEVVKSADRDWLRPTRPSPLPMGYRTSVKLCLDEDFAGRRTIGLYKAGTKQVSRMLDCPAQDDSINQLARKLFAPLLARSSKLRLQLYNHRGARFQAGRLKFVTIRAGSGAHGIIVAHTGVAREALKAWLAAAGLAQLCVYESRLWPEDGDVTVGRRVEHLSGPKRFPFKLGDVTFELAPQAFFQANFALSTQLVAAASGFAEQGDVLLDLYGGFGAYSFAASGSFRNMIVVDGNEAAIDAAQRAAAKLDLDSLEAHAAMCEAFLEQQLPTALAQRVTHVIVNPPRGGLSKRVVSALAKSRFPNLREIRYVSCNPEMLARDAAGLAKQGYTLQRAEPFDMFPQTEHVETVARFIAAKP